MTCHLFNDSALFLSITKCVTNGFVRIPLTHQPPNSLMTDNELTRINTMSRIRWWSINTSIQHIYVRTVL